MLTAMFSKTAFRSVGTSIFCLGLSILCFALLPQSASAQSGSLQARFSDLYKAAAQEREVIFYTDGRQDQAQRLSSFWKATFPNVALRLVPKSSPALIAQIEAERAAGQTRVDVSHMSQPYVALLWKQKGFYERYKTQSFERLRPNYADVDGAYYTPDVYVLPAAYNTKTFGDKSQLPQGLNDFLDPKWKGKMVLGDPEFSGNTLNFLMTMMAAGKTDWTWLEKLAKQDVLFVRGNPDAVRMVASGERVVSPMISSFNIVTSRLKGQPIDFFVLKEGSVVVNSILGLMSKAPHPNAAKLLVEVLTSPEAETTLSEDGVFWPAHPDARAAGTLPPLADLHPVQPPPPSADEEKKVKEFVAKFKTVFGRN